MLTLPRMLEWRTRRWRSALSAMTPTNRTFTLRELLVSLETYSKRSIAPSVYLQRLTALIKDDVASSGRFPERRGGPDTRRPLNAWRSRYNHLDRYLGREASEPQEALPASFGSDVNDLAVEAAENEGWPLPGTSRGDI